jgi:hypothetical protein
VVSIGRDREKFPDERRHAGTPVLVKAIMVDLGGARRNSHRSDPTFASLPQTLVFVRILAVGDAA